MPYVSNLSKKYLPIASDDAVIAATELTVIEAETIGSKSPDACYDPLKHCRPGYVAFLKFRRKMEKHLLPLSLDYLVEQIAKG